jgi:hypothetical protein
MYSTNSCKVVRIQLQPLHVVVPIAQIQIITARSAPGYRVPAAAGRNSSPPVGPFSSRPPTVSIATENGAVKCYYQSFRRRGSIGLAHHRITLTRVTRPMVRIHATYAVHRAQECPHKVSTYKGTNPEHTTLMQQRTSALKGNTDGVAPQHTPRPTQNDTQRK